MANWRKIGAKIKNKRKKPSQFLAKACFHWLPETDLNRQPSD